MDSSQTFAKLTVFLMFYPLLVTSCGGSSGGGHPVQAAAATAAPVVATPTYLTDIKKLIDSECTACHNGKATDNSIDLSAYDGVKTNATKITQATTAVHHGITWTASNQQLFANWVTDGFLEGSATTSTSNVGTSTGNVGTSSTATTYAKDITTLFAPCISCHTDGKWPPVLTTYANVKIQGYAAVQYVIAEGTHCNLTISPDQLKTMDAWVSQGYPQ